MSIELSWVPNSEDNIDHYFVDRSIVGAITADAPFNILTTDTLQLRVDGEELITVTFSSVTSGAATAAQVQAAIEAAISNYNGKANVSG